MQPTNSMREFIKKNDKELRYMVSSLCGTDSSVNDIVQDFYLKALTGNIIESYNPNFARGKSKNPKMSTYLFPIIRNLIQTNRKKPENKFLRNKFTIDPNIEGSSDMDEIELALRFNNVAPDYESTLCQNDNGNTDGLKSDLKDFERKFLGSIANKKFKLRRRKNKNISMGGLSTIDVYNHLKNGLSSREIALKYGVSDMFICILKKYIAKNLIRYGVNYPSSTLENTPLKIENTHIKKENGQAPQVSIKNWTDKDIVNLRKLYQVKTLAEVAIEMRRSVCSIKCKIYKLGIKK